jgi:hypothetical protein
LNHQPEAQHPKSSAIHKLAGRLPHLIPRYRSNYCNATNRRFGPQADSCTAAITVLIDHLVDAGAQRRRHFNAKCLRGLEIDDQLDFRGLLDRQVSRLLALTRLT